MVGKRESGKRESGERAVGGRAKMPFNLVLFQRISAHTGSVVVAPIHPHPDLPPSQGEGVC